VRQEIKIHLLVLFRGDLRSKGLVIIKTENKIYELIKQSIINVLQL
jgi:hypothetical protein